MRHCPKDAALQLGFSLAVRRKESTSRWQALGIPISNPRNKSTLLLDTHSVNAASTIDGQVNPGNPLGSAGQQECHNISQLFGLPNAP